MKNLRFTFTLKHLNLSDKPQHIEQAGIEKVIQEAIIKLTSKRPFTVLDYKVEEVN